MFHMKAKILFWAGGAREESATPTSPRKYTASGYSAPIMKIHTRYICYMTNISVCTRKYINALYE